MRLLDLDLSQPRERSTRNIMTCHANTASSLPMVNRTLVGDGDGDPSCQRGVKRRRLIMVCRWEGPKGRSIVRSRLNYIAPTDRSTG